MRRTAIEEVGGFENSFLAMFEDQAFFAKVLLRFPVFVSDRVMGQVSAALPGALRPRLAAAGADEDERMQVPPLGVRRFVQPGAGDDCGQKAEWVAAALAAVGSRRWMRHSLGMRSKGCARRSW